MRKDSPFLSHHFLPPKRDLKTKKRIYKQREKSYRHLPRKPIVNSHDSHGRNTKTRHDRRHKVSEPLRFLPVLPRRHVCGRDSLLDFLLLLVIFRSFNLAIPVIQFLIPNDETDRRFRPPSRPERCVVWANWQRE